MEFIKTKIHNSFLIKIDKNEDERGFFASFWNRELFEKHGLNTNIMEWNVSFNKKKGTIRGLHYQIPPFQQTKLIRCTKGSIFDVTLDLRPNSKTFKEWIGVELTHDNYILNYIPEGCAHGFQTLENNTELTYQISNKYLPEHTQGINWKDPTFNITWPMTPSIISKKDSEWSFFDKQI